MPGVLLDVRPDNLCLVHWARGSWPAEAEEVGVPGPFVAVGIVDRGPVTGRDTPPLQSGWFS